MSQFILAPKRNPKSGIRSKIIPNARKFPNVLIKLTAPKIYLTPLKEVPPKFCPKQNVLSVLFLKKKINDFKVFYTGERSSSYISVLEDSHQPPSSVPVTRSRGRSSSYISVPEDSPQPPSSVPVTRFRGRSSSSYSSVPETSPLPPSFATKRRQRGRQNGPDPPPRLSEVGGKFDAKSFKY